MLEGRNFLPIGRRGYHKVTALSARGLLKVLSHGTADFADVFPKLTQRGSEDLARVEGAVRQILDAVRTRGDGAVQEFNERFDGRKSAPLFNRDFDGEAALKEIDPKLAATLQFSADRIRRFHEKQKTASFRYEEEGVILGQRVRAVGRAGVYAPGGKARYPSSVLMAAIPAQVAGVTDIVLATPKPDVVTFAAAHLAGVTAILDAGGAQAIAAMAYGTQTVPQVAKIVGPGNIYVAAAKRMVMGEVDIDSIAGPSEILVVADKTASADVIAADLLSQAEHDEQAYPLLVTTEADLPAAVERALFRQLETLPKRGIAETSVRENGYAIVAPSRSRMLELADKLAVEHVALHVERPEEAFDAILNIGAAFVGGQTPEAAGDYLAGPSHVLPTGGAVRYGSPLGVYDFVARSSFIQYSAAALAQHADHITSFARAEGLEAHARAVEIRLSSSQRRGGRG